MAGQAVNSSSPNNRSGLASVQHITLENRVYKELLNGIVSGRLSPGTQVTITELAEQLGVSLMPVRQALKTLAAKNLIRITQNRRLEVRRLSIDDLNELFEIRLKLEQIAAMSAAISCSPDRIPDLERLMRDMAETEDHEIYLERNFEFHHTIYRSANRPILLEFIEDLWFRISPYMHLYLLRDDLQRHNPYHQGMLEGMRKREPEEVARWLKLDLEKAAEELKAQLLSSRR